MSAPNVEEVIKAFEFFGLKSSDASERDVQKAFKKKALEDHPDRNLADTGTATEKFKKVQQNLNICENYIKRRDQGGQRSKSSDIPHETTNLGAKANPSERTSRPPNRPTDRENPVNRGRSTYHGQDKSERTRPTGKERMPTGRIPTMEPRYGSGQAHSGAEIPTSRREPSQASGSRSRAIPRQSGPPPNVYAEQSTPQAARGNNTWFGNPQSGREILASGRRQVPPGTGPGRARAPFVKHETYSPGRPRWYPTKTKYIENLGVEFLFDDDAKEKRGMSYGPYQRQFTAHSLKQKKIVTYTGDRGSILILKTEWGSPGPHELILEVPERDWTPSFVFHKDDYKIAEIAVDDPRHARKGARLADFIEERDYIKFRR